MSTRRRPYGTAGRLVVLGVFCSAVACSLLLQEQSLPCTSDKDCEKYAGSRCDVSAHQCAAGDVVDAAGAADAASEVDALPPSQDAPGPASDGPTSDALALDGSPDVTDAGESEVGPPSEGGADADAGDASPATAINWPALSGFLEGLYDSKQALVQRAPASGIFFSSPDNALAQRAFLYLLPTADKPKSTAINARLSSLKICGCSAKIGHDASINHQFDPLVHKGTTIPLDPGGPCQGTVTDTSLSSGQCVAPHDSGAPFCTVVQHEDRPGSDDGGGGLSWGDSCNNPPLGGSLLLTWNTTGKGMGYADLIALELLSYRNQNLYTETLWQNLADKWDGIGINDSATGPDGSYSTYKVALFKLVARALKKPLPAGVDATLFASQGPNGGIRANYNTSGVFGIPPLDQVGNAEATSLVVLAFLLPDSEL